MNKALHELKHSIRLYLLVMNGPTQQLCLYLLKCVDFIDEDDAVKEKHANTEKEMFDLSYSIIEGMSVYVHRHIDDLFKENKLPKNIQQDVDEILIMIGKTRSLDDKSVAKDALLSSVAKALRCVSNANGTKYPNITNSSGVTL